MSIGWESIVSVIRFECTFSLNAATNNARIADALRCDATPRRAAESSAICEVRRAYAGIPLLQAEFLQWVICDWRRIGLPRAIAEGHCPASRIYSELAGRTLQCGTAALPSIASRGIQHFHLTMAISGRIGLTNTWLGAK
jgi:hypothetical protein